MKKNDQLHSSNVLEVIDSKKCGYLKPRKLVSEHPSAINVFTGPEHWRILHGRTFILTFHLCKAKLSYKSAVLVTSEILGLFRNTFPANNMNFSELENISLSQIWILGLFGNTSTADHMNFPHNRVKFPQEVQELLSQQKKTFSGFLFAFPKLIKIFAHFEKKISVLETTDSKKCGYLNARRLPFQNTFQESTCSRVQNNDELSMAVLSS